MIVDEDNKKERIHGVYIYKNQAFRIRENDWNSHCNVYKGKTWDREVPSSIP